MILATHSVLLRPFEAIKYKAKRQQMKLAGSEVPTVRCLLYEPALNLSVGGKIYERPVFREMNFTNATTKLADFSPHQ